MHVVQVACDDVVSHKYILAVDDHDQWAPIVVGGEGLVAGGDGGGCVVRSSFIIHYSSFIIHDIRS